MPTTTRHPRILFLTQYFPPETGAPQTRIFEMARCLVNNGFEVEVLTAMPNYPTGKIFSRYDRRFCFVEQIDGIRVVRSAIFATKSVRTMLRLTNYFSFVLSSALIGMLRVQRPDVIVMESPPLFLGLTGMFLKAWFHCKLIFNVSDLWPESAIRMGLFKEGLAVQMARGLERVCYRVADAVTAQSPGIIREIYSKHATSRIAHISNGCDCNLFDPDTRDTAFRAALMCKDKIVVGYAGLIGLAQGVQLVVEAAERLRGDDRLRFVVVGDGPELGRIRSEVQKRNLTNFVLTGMLPRKRMPGIVASFDLTLIPLRYFIPGALPSKIYEAMASEVPILLAADGDARELVQRSQAGIVVDYNRFESVLEAIRYLTDHPDERARLGRNGRQYVLRHHERNLIAQRMGQVIMALVERDEAFFASEAV